MNYTTNYNLPQWEATDRITRSSVNSAMASIGSGIRSAANAAANAQSTANSAAAAAAAVSGLTLLKTDSVTSNTNLGYTLNVSDIDFTKWKRVHFLFRFTGNGRGYPTFNGNGYSDVTLNLSDARPVRLTLAPLCSGEMYVCGEMLGNERGSVIPGQQAPTFANLTTFSFTPSPSSAFTVYAGSTVAVYGEK